MLPNQSCEDSLAQIAARDGAIGAFVHLDAENARAAARRSAARWQRGAPLSPLDGMPVAVKANIAVRGLPWHAGIAAYRDRLATADAACVARLRASGVVILGLVNMHEGALGGTTDNPWFGRTQNPWAPGFTAGGSSGGSAAAVAAGLCPAALGTDTLGSVRIPSGYCGVFGHKPAAGRIPTDGVVPLSPRFDTVGIHARSAEACAALLGVLGDAPIALARHARPGRLAVPDLSGTVAVAPDMAGALVQTVERARQAGWSVERLELPGLDAGRLRRLALLLLEIEAEAVHRTTLAADPDGFSEAFRAMLTWAVSQPSARVEAAHREVAESADMLRHAFVPYDALLAPTTPQQAFSWDTQVPSNQADFTVLASVIGYAATAFPVGRANGLPLSVQAVAGDDATTLRIAAELSTP